jgi:hypothetical protein
MVIAVVLGCLSMVAPAEAQLNTQHIKGTVGLKSGSQAPPGVYLIAPLFYVYKNDEVKNRDGVRLPFATDLTSRVYGGGINVVRIAEAFKYVEQGHKKGQCRDHGGAFMTAIVATLSLTRPARFRVRCRWKRRLFRA